MNKERNIVKMDEHGNITMPTDIRTIAMSEWEICELFGITSPTFRAAIKALCESGVLKEYGIKHTVRISDKCSVEVYNLETITALAFRIGTYGAERVRNALLARIAHGRKEKTTVFVSVVLDYMFNSRWQA